MQTRMCFSVVLAAATAIATSALAQDWDQWRGPARTGVAATSPAIASSFGKDGPTKLWQSAEIPTGGEGGYGSVSVVGSRAYIYVNRKAYKPIATRTLDEGPLRGFGWKPEIKLGEFPPELLKLIEETRTSPDREKLGKDRAAIAAWADKWIAEHLNPEQLKKWGPYIKERISDVDRSFLPYDLLDKLVPLKGKPFENEQALNKWLDDNGITNPIKAKIIAAIPTTVPAGNDMIVCLDTADGKTIWQKEHPGTQAGSFGSSSTPLIADGKVYVTGAQTVYCLDAKDGAELWSAPTKGDLCSSSPLLADGRIIVLAGTLTALDAKTGQPLWTQPAVKGQNSSPAAWRNDGKTYILANSEKNLACVDPADGKILWTCDGGGDGSPTIDGDTLVLLANCKQTGIGVVAYRLTPEKPQKLWTTPFANTNFFCTTPVIHEGYVYARPTNAMACINLADGKVMWQEKINGDISSPILVDGKVLVVVNDGRNLWTLRPTPEKCDRLSDVKVAFVGNFTPAVANGRMYVRLPKAVACYDLSAASQPQAATAAKPSDAAPAAK